MQRKVLSCLNLPQHRPFLWFAFEGQEYHYKVLPFGLSLSPRVFTKAVDAALALFVPRSCSVNAELLEIVQM